MLRHLSLLLILSVLGFSAMAFAEHEPDHRYLVLGYVQDDSGKPMPRVDVRAVREKTGMEQRDRTDHEGFYLLVVHLHSEDLGDTLRVIANGTVLRITARFDPQDVTHHRGTRVDFFGNQARERSELFPETLQAFLDR